MPDIRTDIGPAALPATGGSDGFGGFGRSFLTDGVGRGQANKPDDVLQASTFLSENGFVDQPTQRADEGFLRSIEKGQERLNQLVGGGLQVDGIAKPWGPTEMLSQRAVTAGKMKSPSEAEPSPEVLSFTQSGMPINSTLPAAPKQAPGKPTWPVNDGRNSVFNDLLSHTKKIEGGYANRPLKADKGGPTMKGISQKTLDQIRAKYPQWKLPKDTKNLTDHQIDGIYRVDYFDRPKLDKMAAIPGMDRRLVRQIYDSGVLHSTNRAGRWLQQALDKHLGTDLRTKDKTGTTHYDGNIGPQTRAALAEAVKLGKLKDINNTIVQTREAFMRGQSEFQLNPGWIGRAKSFSLP
jgi:lysozyme family protein